MAGISQNQLGCGEVTSSKPGVNTTHWEAIDVMESLGRDDAHHTLSLSLSYLIYSVINMKKDAVSFWLHRVSILSRFLLSDPHSQLGLYTTRIQALISLLDKKPPVCTLLPLQISTLSCVRQHNTWSPEGGSRPCFCCSTCPKRFPLSSELYILHNMDSMTYIAFTTHLA